MAQSTLCDAIAVASDELIVEIVTSRAQLLEAQRLRYRVYCEERGFEPGADGLEQDSFDAGSVHVLLRNRVTHAVLGTVRVVLPMAGDGAENFPMQRVCEHHVLAHLPIITTGEISRFALTRDRAGISQPAAALMRLFLMRGIVQVSGSHSLTHWCAIMESSLIRLLRATAIHFQPVGAPIEYHGIRQPATGVIATVLDRVHREQLAVWSFITDNGSFLPERGRATNLDTWLIDASDGGRLSERTSSA